MICEYIRSFNIQQVFTAFLLCLRHYSRHLGCNNDKIPDLWSFHASMVGYTINMKINHMKIIYAMKNKKQVKGD